MFFGSALISRVSQYKARHLQLAIHRCTFCSWNVSCIVFQVMLLVRASFDQLVTGVGEATSSMQSECSFS